MDLIYQRCTAVNLQSRAKEFNAGKEISAEVQEGVADIAEMLAEGFGRDAKEEEKPTGGKGMAVKLFVSGLIRLAWRWCGFDDLGIGLRFKKLMDCVVLPALHELLNAEDPLVVVLQGRRVCAILDYYDRDLRAIFGSYAAADASVDARAAADSVNLAEFLFMLKQGKLTDDNLTIFKATTIFEFVNMQSGEEEGGDDDEGELVYEEFVEVMARCCDAKINPQSRGGESFEDTLQNWLEYMVVPVFRTLLKDRKRGIAKDKI